MKYPSSRNDFWQGLTLTMDLEKEMVEIGIRQKLKLINGSVEHEDES